MNNYGIAAAIALACVLGGYAMGRYAAPDKVLVTEKVVTVEKQVVVTQTKTEVKIVKVADVQRDVHREKVVEKKPDGSVVVTTKEDDKSKEHTDTRSDATKETVHVEEKLVYKDREVMKLVERNRPSWGLALQPGFAFAGTPTHNLLTAIVPFKRVMANVVIERRLLGPLFVGAWANTRLDGGLSLRLEW